MVFSGIRRTNSIGKSMLFVLKNPDKNGAELVLNSIRNIKSGASSHTELRITTSLTPHHL